MDPSGDTERRAGGTAWSAHVWSGPDGTVWSARNGDARWWSRPGADDDDGVDDVRAPLRVEALATDRDASVLRVRFRDWLARDVPPALVEDLVLAVYEALANAADHAYAGHPGGPGPVRLQAHRRADDVLITVCDVGRWRAPTDAPSARFRGRGLLLMRLLVSEGHIDRDQHGTVVALRAELHPPDPSPGGGRRT